MKRAAIFLSLALGILGLAVWASQIVLGQGSGGGPTAAGPMRPMLLFDFGDGKKAEPTGEKAGPSLGEESEAPQPQQLPDALPPRGAAQEGDANDNPTGRQEPAVSIEWVGPPAIKLGQPATFQIVVKNVSPGPVEETVVRNRVPAGVKVLMAEPKPATDGDLMTWEIGALQPQQEKRIDLQLVPEAKGRCACQATVSFSGQATVNLQVQEPKLQLKATAPDKVLVGDPATVMLTVTNPGDGAADRVKIKAHLSDGLEHQRGKEVEFDLGNLGPKESRSVQVVCGATAGGEQRCDAVATAEGNLVSSDVAVFAVVQPKLELTMTGPKVRYLDRQGVYVFKVTNPGDAPAGNVTITEQLPQGFKFVEASAGGRHDFATRTVSWFLGDLLPHQSREVSLAVMAVNIGEFKHTAMAKAARGLQSDAEVETRVEGLSALLVELVDLDDPVEVGANARYELRITNTGSKTETNIQVVCTVPDKMEFWGAQGAGGCKHRVEGKEVIFEPLPKLAPRADAVYRLSTRPLAAGDLRFRARIKADSLAEPVIKEESTKVFGDEVAPPR